MQTQLDGRRCYEVTDFISTTRLHRQEEPCHADQSNTCLDAPDLLRAGRQAGGIRGAGLGRFSPASVSPAWWKRAQAKIWHLHCPRALTVAEIFAKELSVTHAPSPLVGAVRDEGEADMCVTHRYSAWGGLLAIEN